MRDVEREGERKGRKEDSLKGATLVSYREALVEDDDFRCEPMPTQMACSLILDTHRAAPVEIRGSLLRVKRHLPPAKTSGSVDVLGPPFFRGHPDVRFGVARGGGRNGVDRPHRPESCATFEV